MDEKKNNEDKTKMKHKTKMRGKRNEYVTKILKQ